MSDLRTLEIAYHRAAVGAAEARKVSNASLRHRDELYARIAASRRTLDALLWEFSHHAMGQPVPLDEGRDLLDFVFFSRLAEQYRVDKSEHERLEAEARALQTAYREAWQKTDQAVAAQKAAARSLLAHLEAFPPEHPAPSAPAEEAEPEAHPS